MTSTGFLKPMGGVKGFGIALIVEALAGSLTGAGTARRRPSHDDQGVFMVAIDVQRLRSLSDFTADVEAFIDYVRDVPLEPGTPAVRMPGESGGEPARRRRAAGVPLRSFTEQRLRELADELDVPMAIPSTPSSGEVAPAR